MAAKQAFSLVSGAFGGAGGRDVPGLDVELDAVEVGDGPREAGQRDECRRSNAPPSGAGSNEVAGRRPALGQLGEPEADLSDGQVGVRFGDRKGQPSALGQTLTALAVDPCQGLLLRRLGRKGADEGHVGIGAQLDRQRDVGWRGLAKDDLALARRGRRPSRPEVLMGVYHGSTPFVAATVVALVFGTVRADARRATGVVPVPACHSPKRRGRVRRGVSGWWRRTGTGLPSSSSSPEGRSRGPSGGPRGWARLAQASPRPAADRRPAVPRALRTGRI